MNHVLQGYKPVWAVSPPQPSFCRWCQATWNNPDTVLGSWVVVFHCHEMVEDPGLCIWCLTLVQRYVTASKERKGETPNESTKEKRSARRRLWSFWRR